MSEPCPRCSRPNATFRTTCLYCGATMPNPTARPAEPARRGPDNLDDLVRDAMRGGGTAKLRAALTRSEPDSNEAGGRPAEDRRTPGATRELPFADRRKPRDSWVSEAGEGAPGPSYPPTTVRSTASAATIPPPSPDPDRRGPGPTRPLPFPERRRPTDSFAGEPGDRPAVRPLTLPPAAVPVVRSAPLLPWTDRLVRAAQRAALLGDDPESLLEVLLEAEEALAVAFSTLPEASPTLPPFRQPWLLVLPPFGEPEEIGLSLGVDLATARMLAQGRWPRVGLRGDSPNLGRRPGFDQIAISRDELLAIPPAMGVLASSHSQDAPNDWLVTDETIWLDDPRGGGVAAFFENVRVIVPGEIETRTTREAPSENKWLRKRLTSAGAGTERRIRVIDVHTDRAIFRLVEGTTRTDAIPGNDPTSARKAFARALEHLADLHGDAEVLEERLCNVGGDGKSAWPAWEEHTRIARLYTEKRRQLDHR